MEQKALIRNLNKLLDNYGSALAYAKQETRYGTSLARAEKADRDYIKFCEKYQVFLIVDLPYHIGDIYDHLILLEEIRTGTLFLN